MPDPDRPTLTRETLVRLAREQARFVLSDDEAEKLLPLVNDLQGHADAAAKLARDGIEPTTEFSLEEWPR
jgi:hypothetical protein